MKEAFMEIVFKKTNLNDNEFMYKSKKRAKHQW